MSTYLKTALAAAFLAGSALVASAPSQAASIGVSIGGPGFGLSYSTRSGGYCDRWGCPTNYWGYPIYYGGVYYGGSWYRGPLYYRYYGGAHQYWCMAAGTMMNGAADRVPAGLSITTMARR